MGAKQKPTIMYTRAKTRGGGLRAPTVYYGPAPAHAPTTEKIRPDFTIRLARVEDAPNIAELGMPSHDGTTPNAKTIAEWLEGYKNSQTDCMFVAVEGDTVVGMLNGRAKDKRRTMSHKWTIGLVTHIKYRGCGIGRKLLLHAIHYVKDHPELQKICLSVLARNEGALKLYRSVGFKEEGHLEKDVYQQSGKYVDNLLMGIWVGN